MSDETTKPTKTAKSPKAATDESSAPATDTETASGGSPPAADGEQKPSETPPAAPPAPEPVIEPPPPTFLMRLRADTTFYKNGLRSKLPRGFVFDSQNYDPAELIRFGAQIDMIDEDGNVLADLNAELATE